MANPWRVCPSGRTEPSLLERGGVTPASPQQLALCENEVGFGLQLGAGSLEQWFAITALGGWKNGTDHIRFSGTLSRANLHQFELGFNPLDASVDSEHDCSYHVSDSMIYFLKTCKPRPKRYRRATRLEPRIG